MKPLTPEHIRNRRILLARVTLINHRPRDGYCPICRVPPSKCGPWRLAVAELRELGAPVYATPAVPVEEL